MDSNVSRGGNQRQSQERRGHSQLHDICTLYEYECVKYGMFAIWDGFLGKFWALVGVGRGIEAKVMWSQGEVEKGKERKEKKRKGKEG